jgi:serine/threonine protein kinase
MGVEPGPPGEEPNRKIPLDQLEESDLPTEDGALARSGRRPLGAIPLPSVRGPFRLESLLGKGSHGVVYRARVLETDHVVALKLLNRTPSPKNVERFRREGEICTSLDHPGIVRVHSYGSVEGVPYIAYALVVGCRKLSTLLPSLDTRRGVEYVRDAARALGHAHKHGIVHRDAKASNFLIDGEGRLLVADFGIARLGGSRLTNKGRLVGTFTHMSPEQIAADPDKLGPHTDVWGLGVVIYKVLTGSYPFRGASLFSITNAIVEADPLPPRELDASVPEGLEAVCLKALRKPTEERYADGEALAVALDAALNRLAT